VQQSGPLAASPGSNAPFWSLAYEVWYYILFGLWLFVPGQRRRALLLFLGAVVAGPKILLLLPVWLFGAVSHRFTLRHPPGFGIAFSLFVISIVFLATIISGHSGFLGYQANWQAKPPLYFSSGYLFDYAVGLLVAVHIFAVDRLMVYWRCEQVAEPVNCLTRYLADRSFSPYCFHMPLLYLASVSLPYR
jgi:peptidoglycan/LPS O-acetylase OafA/YrhL